ncbi:hypothetical protein EH331_14250, partial [Enterococcus faecalis]|nr:hypothetical protein [Enterococcus faecalis]
MNKKMFILGTLLTSGLFGLTLQSTYVFAETSLPVTTKAIGWITVTNHELYDLSASNITTNSMTLSGKVRRGNKGTLAPVTVSVYIKESGQPDTDYRLISTLEHSFTSYDETFNFDCLVSGLKPNKEYHYKYALTVNGVLYGYSNTVGTGVTTAPLFKDLVLHAPEVFNITETSVTIKGAFTGYMHQSQPLRIREKLADGSWGAWSNTAIVPQWSSTTNGFSQVVVGNLKQNKEYEIQHQGITNDTTNSILSGIYYGSSTIFKTLASDTDGDGLND